MQSMYLSTIPNDRKNTSLNRDSLQVNDIDGARCRFL